MRCIKNCIKTCSVVTVALYIGVLVNPLSLKRKTAKNNLHLPYSACSVVYVKQYRYDKPLLKILFANFRVFFMIAVVIVYYFAATAMLSTAQHKQKPTHKNDTLCLS